MGPRLEKALRWARFEVWCNKGGCVLLKKVRKKLATYLSPENRKFGFETPKGVNDAACCVHYIALLGENYLVNMSLVIDDNNTPGFRTLLLLLVSTWGHVGSKASPVSCFQFWTTESKAFRMFQKRDRHRSARWEADRSLELSINQIMGRVGNQLKIGVDLIFD